MQYTKWDAAFPGHERVGVLAFGEDPDDGDRPRGVPPMLRPWLHATAWFLAIVPIVSGLMLFRRRIRLDDRVKRAAYCATVPFRATGRWICKHRRMVLSAGLVAGCVCIVIAYVMLPEWQPDWVINHSTSPERVLRASHFAANGHFEATPALHKLLGDQHQSLYRFLRDY